MKLGQTLSVFEAAVPEEIAAPYREALIKLQEEAPPMPVRTVHAVLAQQLGGTWRQRFADFDDQPAAAASIGQVHRATWRDGRDVAVKIQYPGAATALMADLNQLARFARLFAALFPGMDVKPLIAELKARVVEELDYGLEADAQRAFAAAYAGDAQIVVPRVVASAPKVIVSEWLEGTPLSRIIADGTREQRDRAGQLHGRAALLRAPAGRAAARRPAPGQLPAAGRRPARRHRLRRDGAAARRPPRADRPAAALGAGRARPTRCSPTCAARASCGRTCEIDAQGVLDYLRPMLDPIAEPRFHFTRAWMQEQAARIADPRTEASRLGRQLNLPPAYLLIHRVTIGSIGVLCQLDAAGDFRGVLEEWLPGFSRLTAGIPASVAPSRARRVPRRRDGRARRDSAGRPWPRCGPEDRDVLSRPTR